MSIKDYSPKICVSAVPERFQALLPTLAHRLNSAVFCDMLEKIAHSKNISCEDKWWEVLVSVWYEAETEWTNACDALRTGTITLQEAEKLFSLFEKNNKWFEKCKREVQLMAAGGTDSWVEERMEQFQCLSRLSTQRDVAGTLCQIKEEFGYTGDLKDICTIQDVVSVTIESGIHTSVETVLILCICSQHFCCLYCVYKKVVGTDRILTHRYIVIVRNCQSNVKQWLYWQHCLFQALHWSLAADFSFSQKCVNVCCCILFYSRWNIPKHSISF